MTVRVLGISAFYHDSAAALIVDGEIIAAAQEERFNRIKHFPGFPVEAVKYCLSAADTDLEGIDHIAFYDKPFLKFERLIETYVAFAPRGFRSFAKSMPLWIKDKLFQKHIIRDALKNLSSLSGAQIDSKLLFTEHHQSHAASAFYPSPFVQAAVLTMDGVGEWATTSVGLGTSSQLEIQKEIHFPHSLGLLYSAMTYYLGFKVNSGEYKVMGLAPYGTPKYADIIFEHLIDIKEDGSFWLDMSYFDYCTGLTMTNKKFNSLFEGAQRTPSDLLTQKHMDLASSIQAVTEEVILRLARSIAQESGEKNLCLAGGVALNCVANGKLLRDGCFENIWVQPAAGDAGGALGAALAAYYLHLGNRRELTENMDAMKGSYLGPSYDDNQIREQLNEEGACFEHVDDETLINNVANALNDGQAIGWFQGPMEFGPRALGNRSILADPRSSEMQKTLNLKVKYRESFRPFAPTCLAEDVSDWFNYNKESPYMLMVADVHEKRQKKMTSKEKKLFGISKLNVSRSEIPAVTHVDYSARIQTVHTETNPRYHALISAFKKLSGCSVVVNTSFNVRGEPIVSSPKDAFRCFMGTDLDLLAIGNFIMKKDEQDSKLKLDYKDKFELD